MGNANGRIYAPVNTDDVSTVLGVNSDLINYLCSNLHGKINMWAKYKPESHNTPESINLIMRQTNNFGLEPTAEYFSIYAFREAVRKNEFNGGWRYIAPSGNDFMRLDDFVSEDGNAGYDHNATSPFGDLQPIKITLYDTTTHNTIVPADAPGGGEHSIGIDEFKGGGYHDFANWYFGILLFYSPTRYFIATTASKMNEKGDWQVNFGWISPTYAGTYTGVPFLCNQRLTVDGNEPGGLRIVGIGNSGVDIELVKETSLYYMLLTCVFEDRYTIHYMLDAYNKTNTSKTFSNISIYVGHMDYKTGDVVDVVRIGGNHAKEVTVAANSHVNVVDDTETVGYGPGVEASEYYDMCGVQYNNKATVWFPIDVGDIGEDDADTDAR
ncbi:MAG: hypothetical protein K2H46_07370 [Muribaculaceae bacterium]|nr:hypothetical protein [Muribaculaceae bacterium]